jgi:hypothetical protein
VNIQIGANLTFFGSVLELEWKLKAFLNKLPSSAFTIAFKSAGNVEP